MLEVLELLESEQVSGLAESVRLVVSFTMAEDDPFWQRFVMF